MSEDTYSSGVKRTAGAQGWVRSLRHRIKNRSLDLIQDRERRQDIAARLLPSTQERQSELVAFYTEYENLVEVLCDAAQYGPEPQLEERYSALRNWMQRNYIDIRKYVAAYLQYDVADAGHGPGGDERSADAFEALFFWPTLNEFLRADDGHMIQRIMRTRDALNQYGEHLRQLAA